MVPYCFDNKTQSSLRPKKKKPKLKTLTTDLGSFLGIEEEEEMSVIIPSDVGKTPSNISVQTLMIQLMP